MSPILKKLSFSYLGILILTLTFIKLGIPLLGILKIPLAFPFLLVGALVVLTALRKS